jgi:hypothetical protein
MTKKLHLLSHNCAAYLQLVIHMRNGCGSPCRGLSLTARSVARAVSLAVMAGSAAKRAGATRSLGL